MLSSGAHVLIDDDEFMIDESVPNHYEHGWRDLIPDQIDTGIIGAPGKKALLSDTLLWGYDDWGGGEGNRIYYEDEPDRYNWGVELNPRNRGQLTGRPARSVTTLTTADETQRCVSTIGDGALWMGADDSVHYTTDGTTWTSVSALDTGLSTWDADGVITAMAGDSEFAYFAGLETTGADRVSIWRIGATAATDQGAQIDDSASIGTAAIAGMAVQRGKLYAWTGRKLYQLDDPGQTTVPLSASEITKVYDTGTDPDTVHVFNTQWWADCFATENSVIMFYSNDAVSQVYEYKRDVGRPFWRAPYGFTVKSGCYQNGLVYFFGHWGGDSNATGYGYIYIIPLDSLRPIDIGAPRRLQGDNLQLQECAQSYGGQVLFAAARTGRVFIYDTSQDAYSMLDDLNTSTGGDDLFFSEVDSGGTGKHRIGALATFGPRRYAFVYEQVATANTADIQAVSWLDDEPANRETKLNATDYGPSNQATPDTQFMFETPIYDFGYPMERKSLIGFHLTFKPLISGQLIDVSYDLDDAGDRTTTTGWTALTQVTSTTSGASTGRVFIPVATTSDSKKFFQMRFRVALTSTQASVALSPILYGVFAEAKLTRKREEWNLVLRMKDETSRERPADRQAQASRLRDWFEATVESGSVVTFRDGYRYRNQAQGEGTDGYSTHTVIIKEAVDDIDIAEEGVFRVKLVATTEAT